MKAFIRAESNKNELSSDVCKWIQFSHSNSSIYLTPCCWIWKRGLKYYEPVALPITAITSQSCFKGKEWRTQSKFFPPNQITDCFYCSFVWKEKPWLAWLKIHSCKYTNSCLYFTRNTLLQKLPSSKGYFYIFLGVIFALGMLFWVVTVDIPSPRCLLLTIHNNSLWSVSVILPLNTRLACLMF